MCVEFRLAAKDLGTLTERVREAAGPFREAPPPGTELAVLRARLETASAALVVEPADQYARLRPLQRALDALAEFRREAGVCEPSLDARLIPLLARASIDLCEPWRIARSGAGHAWRDWDARQESLQKSIVEAIDRYAAWAENPVAAPHRAGQDERWWRLHRAVGALFELELSVRGLALGFLDSTASLAESLREERSAIDADLRRAVAWVAAARVGALEELDAAAGLVSPDERINRWGQTLRDATAALPESAELVVPSARPRWRRVRPRDAFRASLALYGEKALRGAVEAYWERGAATARDVQRARELLEYWSEVGDADLFADARTNSEALLASKVGEGSRDDLEPALVAAFSAWSEEGYAALEAGQLGWLAMLRRERGWWLLRVAIRGAAQKAVDAWGRARAWISSHWMEALEFLGLRLPMRPITAAVVRRPTLRDTLALPPAKLNLPRIYRTLFKSAGMSDPRFLVGRDQELAGLAQALREWDEGRFAACLVVGARGSGKTSLLNCATASIFAGRAVVRRQFRDRASTPERVDAFLRDCLGVAPDADLAAAFAAERRVLIIEEFERAFLRAVGGFEGIRHLVRWIYRTAETTLWVVALNDKALRVLDAGAEFSAAFSCRVNAMSVSREDLESAVLQRHRLSGLRLRFAPPPDDPRVGRVRRWLELKQSPQKLFFDSLYEQSAGVFRSAFELWNSAIERVEGETVDIGHPIVPQFEPLRAALAQADQFSLLAIQEHGSLTLDELAEVLAMPRASVHQRCDRLAGLGLVEPDPEHPGIRVRPDAQRFVNDLLARVNLT